MDSHMLKWIMGVILLAAGLAWLPLLWCGAIGVILIAGQRLFASHSEKHQDTPSVWITPAVMPALAQRPNITPEGESIRYLKWWRGDHGEPDTGDCLMPDGVYLSGLELNCCFSEDGRYFVALARDELLLLARETRHLYRSRFESSAGGLLGCDGENIHFVDAAVAIEEALEKSTIKRLVAVADLWLEDDGLNRIPQTHINWAAGSLGQRREGRLILPASLLAMEDPVGPLSRPRYQLYLDGVASDIALEAQTLILSAASSDTLACRGWALQSTGSPYSGSEERKSAGYWWWRRDRGWEEIKPVLPEQARLSMMWCIARVEESQVWLEAQLDTPTPSDGWYGQSICHNFSEKVETQRGHDLYGRMQLAEMCTARMEMVWPRSAEGLVINSSPVAGGQRLKFIEHSREKNLHAWTLWLGEEPVPGLWQIEFRVSNDKKYVALLPACAASALSKQVRVLDVTSRKLYSSPEMLIERLRDFADGVLEVIELSGLCSSDFIPHALCAADLPPPPAHRAAEIYIHRGYYRASHCLRRLQITPSGLVLLPDWREVDRPQVANAEGDFILPAPGARDAAWLRGTCTVYSSTWLRRKEPRMGGYLLTASGCALFNVTPSFCWSDDGRYLALTEMIPRGSPDNNDPDHAHQWQFWLLDTEARSVRVRAGTIGRMPYFERFYKGAWTLRTFKLAYEAAKDNGCTQQIMLEALLHLPEVPLVQRERFWHHPDEQQPQSHWQAFDVAVLQPWSR